MSQSLRRLELDSAREREGGRATKSPPRWRRSEISGTLRVLSLLGALLLLSRPLAAGDKVDAVHLRNGDRLTCEIKKLQVGVLTISTDPLGTASVHWAEVAWLESPRNFDVTLGSGQQYFGTLMTSSPGQMVMGLDGGGTVTLMLADLIALVPIGASFWSRVDGNVDAGFSYTQANNETHLTLNATAAYRGQKYEFNNSLASQVTTSDVAERVKRNTISLTGRRSFDNHWYMIGWNQYQQNQELALDLRVIAGGGVGRDLVHTNHRLWSTYGGLVYSHEQFSGEPADQSLEAAVGGQFDFFTPGKEDFKITNGIVSYFNLARKRVRIEMQNAWRHEFLKDFYWSLNAFDSFDGDPPDEQKRNDFGVSFTLGWKF